MYNSSDVKCYTSLIIQTLHKNMTSTTVSPVYNLDLYNPS